MKKQVVFSAKEWNRYLIDQNRQCVESNNEGFKAGTGRAQQDIDILVTALAAALGYTVHETTSLDVEANHVGKLAHGVLRTGGRLVVHLFPKNLLPEE